MVAFLHLMHTLVLHTGTNIENRFANLQKANFNLERIVGKIIKDSPIYETAAWGNEDQNDFLNQALLLETEFSARRVMHEILSLEYKMGRNRELKWQPRIIDIDIIFFDHEVIQKKSLTVPHEHMHNRRFVLQPLVDIIPDFVHPSLQKSIRQLLEDCADPLEVKEWKNTSSVLKKLF